MLAQARPDERRSSRPRRASRRRGLPSGVDQAVRQRPRVLFVSRPHGCCVGRPARADDVSRRRSSGRSTAAKRRARTRSRRPEVARQVVDDDVVVRVGDRRAARDHRVDGARPLGLGFARARDHRDGVAWTTRRLHLALPRPRRELARGFGQRRVSSRPPRPAASPPLSPRVTAASSVARAGARRLRRRNVNGRGEERQRLVVRPVDDLDLDAERHDARPRRRRTPASSRTRAEVGLPSRANETSSAAMSSSSATSTSSQILRLTKEIQRIARAQEIRDLAPSDKRRPSRDRDR